MQLVRGYARGSVSWQRRKTSPGEGLATGDDATGRPVTSSRNWVIVNLTAEAIRKREPGSRSLLVRYESFIARPKLEPSSGSCELVGEEPRPPSWMAHSVHAQPGPYGGRQPGSLPDGRGDSVREDTEWLARQSRRDRGVTTAITLPLLGRYGYPVIPGQGH